MSSNTYPYQARPRSIVTLIVIGSGMAVFFAWLARTNHVGVIINHAIELGPEGADRLYWCFALLGAGLVVLGGALWYVRAKYERHFLIDDNGIELPKSAFTGAHHRVSFADMTSVRTFAQHGRLFLVVKHRTGKLQVHSNNFPAAADFDAVARRLTQALAEGGRSTQSG